MMLFFFFVLICFLPKATCVILHYALMPSASVASFVVKSVFSLYFKPLGICIPILIHWTVSSPLFSSSVLLVTCGVVHLDWSILTANGLVWAEEIRMKPNLDTRSFTPMAVAYCSFVSFSVDHMDYRCSWILLIW